MPDEQKVIVNASPLIALFRAELAHLLTEMWQEVLVPEAVRKEVMAGGIGDTAAYAMSNAPWVKQIDVGTVAPEVAAWDLGSGETEVLSLATQMRPQSFRVVLDDAQARKCARVFGFPLSGTGGILVLAKQRGLLTNVSDVLNSMTASGFWASPRIVELLKRKAGENVS